MVLQMDLLLLKVSGALHRGYGFVARKSKHPIFSRTFPDAIVTYLFHFKGNPMYVILTSSQVARQGSVKLATRAAAACVRAYARMPALRA